MFRVGQVITPTRLLRSFTKIARHLERYPQALLITKRSGKHLVLMDAELFDEMMVRCSNGKVDMPPETGLKDELEAES